MLFNLHARLRAHCAPRHSLRPLIIEARTFPAKPGRIAPRDRGGISEIGVTSLRGAKRRSNPFLLRGNMDCFAEPVIGRAFARPRWLAMTNEMIKVRRFDL